MDARSPDAASGHGSDTKRSGIWWYERGKTTRAPFWWWRLGPLVTEFHADRFSFGVVASRWFVGVYLGFFVVTFGKRVWVETSRPTTAWLVGTLSMEEVSRGR
jgi:hypothetical protein